ncbi:hypothetical protein TrLO_g14381 [Triparma laevis f. longispina]|uniref:PhoD-like phosphatase metallophosphatase domain-containing protein n=1 Tax=Triparma laevis f. longispina TaxID=1714387 RepID=A0A9W7FTD8_9STRA|nr:hypothetical protein TrLO_g14381 [Triparma laevis f. longispina]
MPLHSSTDHTSTITLASLNPSSTYEYTVLNVPNEPSSSFTTLPTKHAPGRIKFAFSSCAMKSMHVGYELSGFTALRNLSPSFALFLGDLVYADVPLSWFGLGTNTDAYRAHYRRTFDDPHMSKTGLSLPIFYMYDDHEILNDVKGRELESFKTAVDVWREYAGSSNMGTPLPDADLTENNGDGFMPAHFAMDAGPACVFVMDTRGFRDVEGKSVLGEGQMTQVKSWLLRSKDVCPFKILASPVPVTPNYSHLEGWGGSDDLAAILTFTEEEGIDGVVFISGDSHMQGVYEIAPGILEISSSPASAQGPPFQTISGDKGQVVWEQTEIGQHCSEQWGTVDVDTSITGGEKMVVGLYSNCGKGEEYGTPLLEITIDGGKDWSVTGGSQGHLAVAQNANEIAAGGVLLRTQKVGGGAVFVAMMEGTSWVTIAVIVCVVVVIALGCCGCARRKIDGVCGGKSVGVVEGGGEEREGVVEEIEIA